jgi:hypothetical protein
MADSIDANYAAVPICMRTAISELHVVTAYRHGEGQEVHRQGGHAGQLAFNGQTVDRSSPKVPVFQESLFSLKIRIYSFWAKKPGLIRHNFLGNLFWCLFFVAYCSPSPDASFAPIFRFCK